MPKKPIGPKLSSREEMRVKALFRRAKKQGKRFNPDRELLAKYMNKPPTLETLFELIREGQRTHEKAEGTRIYFLKHLTNTLAERKIAIKARIAFEQDTTSAFARSLLESRARNATRKQGKVVAKEELLAEIAQVIEKIKRKSKQFLNPGETP